MAKNGKPGNKVAAAREIMKASPHLSAAELRQSMKDQYGIDISAKVAGTYRYHLRKEMGQKQRRAVKAASGVPAGQSIRSTDGLDDLLQAANKLGWQRVKEIVDKVLDAPT